MPSFRYLRLRKEKVMDMHNNELLEACKHDRDLLEELLQENRKYIFSIILKYKGSIEELRQKFGVDEEEILQHAYIGILSALRDYDPAKSKFTTFLVRPVLWEINQLLYCDSRLVRLSRGAVELLKKMKEIEDALGYLPTEEEFAEIMKVPLSRIAEVIRFTRDLEHFDNGEQLQIKDSAHEYTEERILNRVFVEQLLQSRDFTAREKQIIQLIKQGKNNSQISEILGVYPMTVNRDIVRIRDKVLNCIEDDRKSSKYDAEIDLIADEIKERGILTIDDISDLLDVCGFGLPNYTSRILYYIRQKAMSKAQGEEAVDLE